ncbi:FAD-binding oxidoreductase [Blastococcus sp. SYSU DS0533]
MTVTDAAARLHPAASALRTLCGGAVHLPGDPSYDEARMAWNLAVDQRPAAVCYPGSAAEVAEVVRAVAAAGLRVAPQGTGHNAGPLGDLSGTVLLRTAGMRQVHVDRARERVTVGAGCLWIDVVGAAAEHGLTVLHGSSPDVGVVGYSLGGGIGWYARSLGLQTNAITAAELVTADGEIRRVDAEHDAALFWALRGGGANAGIVTELEFRAFPFTEAYAGMLVWDVARAEAVLPRWAEWADEAPDEVTTAFRFLRFPDVPELPAPFRGRSLLVVDGAVLADDAAAGRVLAPLRDLAPEIDTFGRVPTSSLIRLHMDPEAPTPGISADALLGPLSAAAIDRLLEVAGAGAADAPPMIELRQLGGALGRPAPGAGVLPQLDGRFALFTGGLAFTPEMSADSERRTTGVVRAMAPWANGRRYLNFSESRVDVRQGYREQDWQRLRAVREQVDPLGVIVANHAVAGGDEE